MKALNCANCGANLNYIVGSPVSICQFCNSVILIDNLKIKIEQPFNSSIDGPPRYIDESKTSVMRPISKYMANHFDYPYITFYSKGGHLWISENEIFFKPHQINLGDLSKKLMKLEDIVEFKKELFPMFLTIIDKKGFKMRLSIWNRNKVINEIEKLKLNLAK